MLITPRGYEMFFRINSAEYDFFSAHKYRNTNNSCHFHIYLQRKVHAQLWNWNALPAFIISSAESLRTLSLDSHHLWDLETSLCNRWLWWMNVYWCITSKILMFNKNEFGFNSNFRYILAGQMSYSAELSMKKSFITSAPRSLMSAYAQTITFMAWFNLLWISCS